MPRPRKIKPVDPFLAAQDAFNQALPQLLHIETLEDPQREIEAIVELYKAYVRAIPNSRQGFAAKVDQAANLIAKMGGGYQRDLANRLDRVYGCMDKRVCTDGDLKLVENTIGWIRRMAPIRDQVYGAIPQINETVGADALIVLKRLRRYLRQAKKDGTMRKKSTTPPWSKGRNLVAEKSAKAAKELAFSKSRKRIR
ncbi:hypothetical protein FHS85_000028 [Rhodoligotrophos appendicifer]|uniref:hypothetical protein n=1 Tax=Rhodoligotrophos appendicifer TaxID=987056 RepID=UPI0011815E40|nr:hypothetical protein [Rhodoligotrophos appendicifer]